MNMNFNVLLIGGEKQSGKSTLLKNITTILRKEGRIIKELGFAHPFKDLLFRSGICTFKQLFGSDEDKNTKTKVLAGDLFREIRFKYGWAHDYLLTAREVMQIFGNDYCKQFSKTIWVDHAKYNIENDYSDLTCGSDLSIFEDYRFTGLEDDMPYNLRRITLVNKGSEFLDKHESENSLDHNKSELVLLTDKSNINNMLDNTNIALRHIKRWFSL